MQSSDSSLQKNIFDRYVTMCIIIQVVNAFLRIRWYWKMHLVFSNDFFSIFHLRWHGSYILCTCQWFCNTLSYRRQLKVYPGPLYPYMTWLVGAFNSSTAPLVPTQPMLSLPECNTYWLPTYRVTRVSNDNHLHNRLQVLHTAQLFPKTNFKGNLFPGSVSALFMSFGAFQL